MAAAAHTRMHGDKHVVSTASLFVACGSQQHHQEGGRREGGGRRVEGGGRREEGGGWRVEGGRREEGGRIKDFVGESQIVKQSESEKLKQINLR